MKIDKNMEMDKIDFYLIIKTKVNPSKDFLLLFLAQNLVL